MSRRRPGPAIALAAIGAVAVVALAWGRAVPAAGPAAADPVTGLDAPAAAAAAAVRVSPPPSGGTVSVSQVSDLSTPTIAAAQAAAAQVGASSALGRGFSIGMTAVRRGGGYVQLASGGSGRWQYPMGVTALPIEALQSVMSTRVAAAVSQGSVVMGETSAGLRGAQAGDVVDLVAASGAIVSFSIGLVAPDAEVGGTEIVMSPSQADQLGAVDPTRVLIYGTFARDAIDAALVGQGLTDGQVFAGAGARVRIRRSWWPADPDSVIGLARTKALLGEFDYTLTSDGGVSIDSTWRAANIVEARFADVAIRSSCHRAIVGDLQAALSEVAALGLAGAIDVGNTNSYGGCYFPRFNRVTGSLGFLSRHSWGQPIDMNTLANAQGKVPKMDCRVVRIFRKHGFAWGGNFISIDGMHFEWVGEPRDQLQYPSAYCPNLPGGAIQDLQVAPTQAATLFADDGWVSG